MLRGDAAVGGFSDDVPLPQLVEGADERFLRLVAGAGQHREAERASERGGQLNDVPRIVGELGQARSDDRLHAWRKVAATVAADRRTGGAHASARGLDDDERVPLRVREQGLSIGETELFASDLCRELGAVRAIEWT